MKQKRFKAYAAGFFLSTGIIMAFSSCPPAFEPAKPEIPQTFEEVSELFVEDPDTHVVTFLTNDPKYRTPNGYTLWTVGSGKEGVPFVSRTVRISKPSGDEDAGYGVVFCHGLREGFGQTMLVCLINRKGQYLLGEAQDAVFTAFTEDGEAWRTSGALHANGIANDIALSYDSGTSNFSLVINGTAVCTFNDDVQPIHTTGNDGYIVVISPQDVFPDDPVEVSFLEVE